MRPALIGLGLVGVGVLIAAFAEPLAPRVEVTGLTDTIGRGTPMRVVATDRGSGLADVEVRLVPEDGSAPLVLARQDFPRRGLLGSGVHETTLTPTLGANVPVPEGKAKLEVYASDHSLLSAVRRWPRFTREVLVDVTPPKLEVLGGGQDIRVGSSELVIARVGSDAVSSGVQVGDLFFPASTGVFKEPELRTVLFALPADTPDARPVVVATDAAGNRREEPLNIKVEPRKFVDKTLAVTDGFLQRKVPELLDANGLPNDGNLVDGYLHVNRDLRTSTEARIREICSATPGPPLWSGDDGGFVRMPGAALSRFADRRRYTHDGNVIDNQMHLGYDIASFKHAPIPAAASGRVQFAGPLGIYGNAIILDHGLGLYTLYGHLSEISVTEGTEVKRGDVIGKTGETGLAGGDHLHFSTMVQGVHVDPINWWDRGWVVEHVFARLAKHPRPAPPTPEPAAEPASEPTS
jgi:murein DD-endopeptidase MepM/ murein hydrolase activator NlpD